MFSLFKKKILVKDLKWMGVDIHSHLLPGIDDGSPDVGTSVRYIKALKELGITKFHCTPHILAEYYPNTPETINAALAILKQALKAANVDVEVTAAAEHMVDDTFRVTDELLCLPGKHILVEMSYLSETPNIEQVIFDLQIKGYKVILAHPERYNFYHKSHDKFHRLKDMGVLFQMNLLSIVGYYGKEVKRTAEYLLEHQCYDLAGTDLHHDKHLEILSNSVLNGKIHEKLGVYPFKNQVFFV
ncbi:tyrosine-protein phosphatase [Pedobacter sp.]|uniref:tyrosine-protein phosphatase n=1 Tax=Pedobacter sp. TaxID=1411316 RepID=UPI003D7FA6B1